MAQTTLPLAASGNVLNLEQLPLNAGISGLYVHIPFCFHKCHYCDFYSITRQTPQRMQQFVDRILAEADQWAKASNRLRPKTIFFGGGTPSLLPIDQMARLIDGLGQRFDLSDVKEWTVEVNPATASIEYFEMLKLHGVDRISLGAQSFDKADLALLERHHDPNDVPASIEAARKAGFARLNIDLIYAIPGQSFASWEYSLEAALQLGLTHYSCYGLTYEPNTPIAVRKRMGQFAAATDELELAMLHQTRRRLAEAGCPAYEISNYAAPGQECLHNLMYWTGGSYIGLGPGAASHLHGCRFKNYPHLGEWEHAIDSGRLPTTDIEKLSPLQRAGERMMLQLRLSRGIDYDDYTAQTGFDARSLYAAQIEELARLGLIETDQHGLRLTNKGLNVADTIAGQFLSSNV